MHPLVTAPSDTSTREEAPLMSVLAIVLAACSLWGVVATAIAVHTDGYAPVPSHGR